MMQGVKPNEVYNLAAQSHLQVSFEMLPGSLSGVGYLITHAYDAPAPKGRPGLCQPCVTRILALLEQQDTAENA